MEEPNTNWKFAQCFGEKDEVQTVVDADIISAVEFDETGHYLATGDKGGRVVLFHRDLNKKNCEYHFLAEFQSHEPEFDYLKSLEIEEKINKIRWCKRQARSQLLLTTNDKTIKLWKVNEKSLFNVIENNFIYYQTKMTVDDTSSTSDISLPDTNTSSPPFNGLKNTTNAPSSLVGTNLKLPKMVLKEEIMLAVPKKVYSQAHAYHINSISVNSDGETFLSADDLRIHIWHLNNEHQSFNVVDLKPNNMEDLSEVITAAEFHPKSCHQFIYGTSKGVVKICDLRTSAICDQYAQLLEDKTTVNKSFFNEIICSISDVKHSPDGRYLVARDYMYLKLWDIRMEQFPVLAIPVHEHLRPKLCDLYESDSIFDKFECGFNGNGTQIMTGSYNNILYIFDLNGNRINFIHSDKSIFNNLQAKKGQSKSKFLSRKKKELSQSSASLSDSTASITEPLEPSKKIIHASWHPQEDTMAVAATNNLFIFTASH